MATDIIGVDGTNLAVLASGNGPAVLLVHGFPDTHRVWRRQVPVLVDAGYRVLAPDLRGYGDSDAPADVNGYHVDRLVDDLVGVLDAYDVPTATVVGHDWGSVIGWRMATTHPDRVGRLVALSVGHPRAVAESGLAQKLRSSYVLLFQTPVVAEKALSARDFWLLRQAAQSDSEAASWRADLSRPGRLTSALAIYRANRGILAERDWAPLHLPVMGMWGEGDVALAEEQMLRSGRWVAGGWRYERIAGGGHWLQLERPTEVNARLLHFLESCGSVDPHR